MRWNPDSEAPPLPRAPVSREKTALIFDFDGVLADTETLHWRSWSALLASQGISFSWEDYCRFGRGISDLRMLETMPHLAAHPALRITLRDRMPERKQMVRLWCAQQSPVSRATITMLQDLSDFRLGLVTSSDRDEVEPLLRAAGIHACFAGFVYGDQIHRQKPDPEPYLLIREKLRIETGLAFEDSEPGLISARSAGLTAICVDSPGNLPAIVAGALRECDSGSWGIATSAR